MKSHERAPKKQSEEFAEGMKATMTSSQNLQAASRKLIAPLWHTGLLLLFILALTLAGAYVQRSTTSNPPAVVQQGGKAILYLSLIALQYGLYRLVISGLRRSGHSLGDIVGRRDSGARSVGTDLLIAAGFWIVGSGVLALIKLALGSVDDHTGGLLPQGLLESVLWVIVSAAAGFCEEIFYRGYLQRQFLALSGSVTIAILAQAILFGISHSYQGIKSTVVIMVYGVMFGLLAQWRGSLRPGMMAHAWTDIIGGLFKV